MRERASAVLAAGAGDEGGHDVGGMPIEGPSRSVVTHRYPPVLSSSLKKSPSVAICKSISISSGSDREHACRKRFRLPK